MTRTVGRIILFAAGTISLVTLFALGGLAWTGWHAAAAAHDAGADAAARDLRFLSAMLLVSTAFLIGTIGLVSTHVLWLFRGPVDEMRSGLARFRAGSLHERIVPQGPLEIRALIREINAVTSDLLEGQALLERTTTTQTIDALIAGVAHEVHTPLTSLKIHNHLLDRQVRTLLGSDDVPQELRAPLETMQRTLGRVQHNHERLERLTRALREVVRHDPEEPGRDPNLLVAAALAIAHHRMPANVQVDNSLHAARFVACPASELFHVAHGLLLDASERVHDHGRIEIATHDVDDEVMVRMRYTGDPVPRQLLELLDDPKLPEHGSPLLRLRTIRRTVTDHGGQLEHDRTEDGAEWRVRLPKAERPDRTTTPPDEETVPDGAPTPEHIITEPRTPNAPR